MSYEVTTPVYTGPFDLLLQLITKRQVEIYEISLAEIVDAYLAELEKMQDLNLEVATEFLLIAATLVELKSARLLPSESDVEIDDELSIFERRDLLIARILDAKAFKDASAVIHERLIEGSRYWPRTAGLEDPFLHLAPDLFDHVTPERFAELARRGLEARPEPRVDTTHIHKIEITVGEVMHGMADELEAKRRATFRDLTLRCSSKIEIAVHFLGMLELYKQNLVDIEQFTTFGEITVIWAPVEYVVDWGTAGAEWDDDGPAGESEEPEQVSANPQGTTPKIDDPSDANTEADQSDRDDRAIAEFVEDVAAELDLDLSDDDSFGDEELFDPKLLDNSDLLAEAADLLGRPARGDGWTESEAKSTKPGGQ